MFLQHLFYFGLDMWTALEDEHEECIQIKLLLTWLYCLVKSQFISTTLTSLVAWHSGRTSVSGRRTFPVLRLTCS